MKCQVSALTSEVDILKQQMSSLEQTIHMKDEQLKEQDEEIEKLEDARAEFKKTIDELNINLQEQQDESYDVKKKLH